VAEDVKKLVASGQTFWSGLSPARKSVMALAAVVTIGVVLFTSLRDASETYDVLFTNLTPDDSDRIQEDLKKSGIPFRADRGGALIRVPAERVSETRIALASSGYPRGGSGVGFEVFDKQSWGTTGFVEQMNYRRALQGELERTIRGLGAIEGARVHIAIPEHSLFRDQSSTPSASVAVRLFRGRKLSSAQVRGIVNLVAFSVPGLAPEHVSVVDDTGRPVSDTESGAGSIDAQKEMEGMLAGRVVDILERVVGPGHADVQVTADLDFTKETTTQELYDKDKTVVRSEQRTEDWTGGSGPTAAGVAGARGNLPGAPAVSSGTSGSNNGKITETRNYEISKTIHQKQEGSPRINRLYVAILVDGIRDPSFKPTKKVKEAPVIARTEAELAPLAALAKQVVGFDEARGDKLEIHSSTFVTPAMNPLDTVEEEWPAWARSKRNQLLAKGIGLIVAIVAGFAALVVLIRSVRLRRGDDSVLLSSFPKPVRDVEAEMMAREMPEPAPLPMPMPIPALAEPSAPPPPPPPPKPRELAAEAAKKDLVRTVRVISNWLTEVGATPGRGRS
jgi:flagellar M-ring protein FliF